MDWESIPEALAHDVGQLVKAGSIQVCSHHQFRRVSFKLTLRIQGKRELTELEGHHTGQQSSLYDHLYTSVKLAQEGRFRNGCSFIQER